MDQVAANRLGQSEERSVGANMETNANTIAALSEFFPQCFHLFEQRRRPLKVGIWNDIKVVLGGAITDSELTYALRSYTSNRCYLQSCLTAGTPRIDLNGEVAGQVTESEAAHAAERLKLQTAKWKARQQNKKAKPPAASAPPAARRLSLGDLRQAAAVRKAASGIRRANTELAARLK
jgi:ProP effector